MSRHFFGGRPAVSYFPWTDELAAEALSRRNAGYSSKQIREWLAMQPGCEFSTVSTGALEGKIHRLRRKLARKNPAVAEAAAG